MSIPRRIRWDMLEWKTNECQVPNATATGGSSGTDLNGQAVVRACQQVAERLQVRGLPPRLANCHQPFRDGGRTWEEAVAAAYEARTQLSAFGFYNTSPLDAPSPDADSGSVFLYLTNGVGCSLVELDCLTGGHAVLRWPRAQPPSPGPTLSWTSAGASTLASTSGRWRAPSCRASATPPWRSLSPPATGRSSLSRRWWRPLCAGTWGSTRCRPWRTCRGS